ncbi:MAG: 2,3-diphosphoglycerate-dependent phosphoglycerate mutase [Acidimicrobiales bacterium]|nr:2,3-diphosphoglycerate-dependent phosphoglycerate mutase [Acidimicrobiales bacterium]
MARTTGAHRLVLLRHGESEWNQQNLFTGWWDAQLTELGTAQATAAGELMTANGIAPDVVHTSLQTRAIRTAELALAAMGRSWIPVRRDWRLNERHYGDLTGRNKADTTARFGAEQVKIWRRSYDVRPPDITPDNPFDPNADERYAQVPPGELPLAECLKDVVERLGPYWDEVLAPDLRAGSTVLVGAHGNSLRALVKLLDGIGDDAIVELNIPTGEPLVYELAGDLRPVDAVPVEERYLRSAAEIRAAAEAVAKQAEA